MRVASSRKKKKAYDFNPQDHELFRGAVGVCSATAFEHLMLWEENERKKRVTWGQETRAAVVQIGHYSRMPVNVFLRFAVLGGRRVVFWECTSTVIDFRMVEAWLEEMAPGVPRTDAMNFANTVNDILRAQGK